MALKWLKYALKRQALSVSPALYWRARTRAKGLLEPELALVAELCPRDRAMLDVGANWGAYTHWARGLARSVHAFEPQPMLARVLRRGTRAASHVTVHELALSDRSGWTEIRVPKNDIGYATIEAENRLNGTADLSRGCEVLRVETRRLDDLDVEPVGFVKIDVEGHEASVLAGGRALLERDRPVLLVEVEERHRKGAVEQVASLAEGLGYECFGFRDGQLHRRDVLVRLGGAGRNLIFVHAAEIGRLRSGLVA